MFLNNFKRIQFVCAAIFFVFAQKIDAATLWIESNTSNVKIGDIVTATLYVNANGEPINNIESELQATNFEIQSISNSGSILNMWVEQPVSTFKSASFNGGVLNPGYSGSSGKLVTVSLKAIKEGVGTLAFGSAAVRANDGLGTDVLKSKSNLSVAISPVTSPVPVPNNVQTETKPDTSTTGSNLSLKAPLIYSSTSPDSDRWYNFNETKFTWDVPKNVTALKTLLGSYPDSEPIVLYDSVIQSKTVSDIPDGVWYFHLKYQTSKGWSQTGHKKIKIDTTAPESITVKEETLESKLIKINLSAYDKTSYITKFVLSTPNNPDIEITNISKEGETEFVFPYTYEGEKEITIQAFDSANNVYEEKFSIDFPEVSIPKITVYPSEVTKGDSAIFSGISNYKNSKIELNILLSDGKVETYTSQTKEDGSFSFEIKSLNIKGELSASVKVSVEDSQIPIVSKEVKIYVVGFDIMQEAQNLLRILLVIVPIIILLAILVGILYFIKIKLTSNNPNKERRIRMKQIEKETIDFINSLKTLIVHDIHVIGADRSITDTEEVETILLKNLSKDFKDIEKRISNRLKRRQVSKKRTEEE